MRSAFQLTRNSYSFSSRWFSSSSNRKVIDLRSDTVTSPSRGMLQAALSAPTGDDVMGEDETVNQLQEYVATLFGTEAALYCPTGTMCNLVAIQAHCNSRAAEIIVGSNSHVCLWEGGNVSTVAGVHSRQLAECPNTAQIPIDKLCDTIRSDNDDHFAKTAAVCLENTHNMLGGTVLPVEYLEQTGALCKEHGIALHIDGARIFNAAVYLNTSVKELCAAADTISVCLSKGLGAPLGSVLVGSAQTIWLAKRARKRCGGGMRQAGVVAAMGMYALEHNRHRLHQDHQNARQLAEYLERHGFCLPRAVQTNIFYFGLPADAKVGKEAYLQALEQTHGVKLTGGYSDGGRLFRVVTHLDISEEDIERASVAMVAACFG